VEANGELPSVEADLLIVGDLVVDRSRARITRGGKTINLTPTEFRLLVFFAQHPGQVFSRTQLMDNVWGCTADYCDNQRVNVHMRRLREKIEMEPNAPQLLLTVPGIGYRLAVSA
jgi:DNA-binding response OmpR family regulator